MRDHWATITLLKNACGASTANGSTGRAKPATVPPRKTSARRGARSSPPPGISRASRTSTGMTAQVLHTPANPNAAPPAASRRLLPVSWSPSITARAPARQNSTSHGSISTVWAAYTPSG